MCGDEDSILKVALHCSDCTARRTQHLLDTALNAAHNHVQRTHLQTGSHSISDPRLSNTVSVSGGKVQITTGARTLSTLHRSILAEYNAIASSLIATELPLDPANENLTTESTFQSLNTFKESELKLFQLLSGSLS